MGRQCNWLTVYRNGVAWKQYQVRLEEGPVLYERFHYMAEYALAGDGHPPKDQYQWHPTRGPVSSVDVAKLLLQAARWYGDEPPDIEATETGGPYRQTGR